MKILLFIIIISNFNIVLDGTEETENFKLLYQELVNICSGGRKLKEITPQEKQVIEQVANSETSSRVEAEAILTQIDKKQLIRIPEDPQPVAQMSRQSNIESNEDSKIILPEKLLSYPSPAGNELFVDVHIREDYLQGQLNLVNITTGQIISSKALEQEVTGYKFDLGNVENGFYSIVLLIDNELVEREKVVVLK